MKAELDRYAPHRSVHIATPAYDARVESGYTQSLIIAAQECLKHGIEASSSIPSNGAFIDIMRCILVKQFLEETDCTHLMWVDSDLKFDADAIAGLVMSDMPVAAGIYRQREADLRYVVKLPNDLLHVRDGWIEMERCPGGFMCIERSVLEKMADEVLPVDCGKHGKIPMIYRRDLVPKNGVLYPVGEDIFFCDLYTRMYKEGKFSEPIWAYPDINFVHAGYECNFHNYLSELYASGNIHNPAHRDEVSREVPEESRDSVQA